MSSTELASSLDWRVIRDLDMASCRFGEHLEDGEHPLGFQGLELEPIPDRRGGAAVGSTPDQERECCCAGDDRFLHFRSSVARARRWVNCRRARRSVVGLRRVADRDFRVVARIAGLRESATLEARGHPERPSSSQLLASQGEGGPAPPSPVPSPAPCGERR